MTPKEKASELIETFWIEVRDYKLTDPSMSKKQAKQCALIAVDEILNEYWLHDTKRRDWWQEVKQEIDKL